MSIKKAPRSLIRSFVFVLIGVALGLAWKYYQAPISPDGSARTKVSSPIVAPGFNPKFNLINHDGAQVTEQDYNDKYQLVYFGFTFCPEICPTELQKIASILDIIGEEKAAKIYPIFVSVDPTRDTPDVMKQYIANFGADFVGLTGTEEQVDEAMSSFKVYASKTEDPEFADYMMAHSSYLYFLDKNGDLLGLYKKEDKAEQIAEDVNSRLAN